MALGISSNMVYYCIVVVSGDTWHPVHPSVSLMMQNCHVAPFLAAKTNSMR